MVGTRSVTIAWLVWLDYAHVTLHFPEKKLSFDAL